MLSRLANLAVARRRLTLVAAVVLFAVAGSLGGDVAQQLSSGGFADPDSESFQADQALIDTFGVGVPNVVLLVTATEQPDPLAPTVDRPRVTAAGLALTQQLAAEEGLTNVVSYWSLGNVAPLRSDGGNRALVLGRILGDEDTVDARVEELAAELEGNHQGLDVAFSGYAHIFGRVGETIEADLVRAELIAVPITLLLLLVIFRGVVAALLPLAVGALSVVSTFLVLETVNRFTDVSVFALNLTTAMGLGLAIDYALFVVNRYREEVDAGFDRSVAIDRTVRTAGRTVAFSAGTVAASLLALLVFPLGFLRSFAYAGVAVAGLAGLYSVTVLPAMLAALGPRIESLSVRRRPRSRTVEEGGWYRVATATMRRPLPVATAVIAVLLFLGTPFLRIDLGLPDDRVLPADDPVRMTADVLRDEFSSVEAGAASVVATDIGDPTAPPLADAIDGYATRLSLLADVARVDAATGIYLDGARVVGPGTALTERFVAPDATFLSVVPEVEPNSAEGEAFVQRVRDEPAPFPVAVTGLSAELVDSKAALFSAMPLALAIIAIVTFALLFLLFGSVIVPLKALALNVLSLTATFGAMVWIFQDGNLSGLLDFTAVGSTDASTPILMFCVAFGLSMDYEVFLLSRIKEEYDRTGDNRRAVAVGLEKTGRIVTAAALLISVVFLAFGTSDVRFIKLFGLGLALAVLTDAFVIRGTLVPAFMRLADEGNWWAPAPLRRFHDRFGISEHVDLDPAPAVRSLPAAGAPTDESPTDDHERAEAAVPVVLVERGAPRARPVPVRRPGAGQPGRDGRATIGDGGARPAHDGAGAGPIVVRRRRPLVAEGRGRT